MTREDFAAMMEASLSDDRSRMRRRLEVGATVEGTVIAVSGDSVFVDVGATQDARVPRSELTDDAGALRVKPGDRLRATVKSLDGGAPELAVALGRSGGPLDLGRLELVRDARTPVEGRVLRAVKAGLEVEVAGIRCFCPASQVDLAYQADLTAWEGRTLTVLVTEVKEEGRSVIVSRRAFLELERAERAAAVRARLAVGTEVEGTVASLTRHGAVVDLGGLEAFVHVSELAHGRVASVEDVVAVGAPVRARVLSMVEGPRGLDVRLSLKALAQPDPGATPAQDEVLTGTVARLGSFGVIVETPKGEGLVPVKELGLPPGADHRRAFPVGTPVSVVLMSREGRTGKLRFSIRNVAAVEERRNFHEFAARGGTTARGGGSAALGSLGELLRARLGLAEPTVEEEPHPTPPSPCVVPAPAPPRPTPPAIVEAAARRPVRSGSGDPPGVHRRRR